MIGGVIIDRRPTITAATKAAKAAIRGIAAIHSTAAAGVIGARAGRPFFTTAAVPGIFTICPAA